MIVILKAKLPYLVTFGVLQDLLLVAVNSCFLDQLVQPVRGMQHLRDFMPPAKAPRSHPHPVPVLSGVPSVLGQVTARQFVASRCLVKKKKKNNSLTHNIVVVFVC